MKACKIFGHFQLLRAHLFLLLASPCETKDNFLFLVEEHPEFAENIFVKKPYFVSSLIRPSQFQKRCVFNSESNKT